MAYAYSGLLLTRHAPPPRPPTHTHTYTRTHKWPLKFSLSMACGQQVESCAFASRALPFLPLGRLNKWTNVDIAHNVEPLKIYSLPLQMCVCACDCGSVYLWQKVIDIVIDGTLGRRFLGLWLDMMTNYSTVWPMNFAKRGYSWDGDSLRWWGFAFGLKSGL